MNICTPNHLRRGTLFYRAAAFSVCTLATCVIAQESEEDEEVYDLSPFTVKADTDQGYRAENTLAGTRLNSSLKDSAAAISVYNKEFLNDIGATDDLDALLYSVNADLDLDNSGPEPSGGNQMLEFAANFTIRGLKASRGRNFFDWTLSMDSYNTERFDESRGPNSVLFGLGSPGGILNTSTKRASVSQDFGEVSAQVGNFDLLRGTLDLNKVLVKDKLAVRFNAMQSEETGDRLFSFEDKWANHLAVTFAANEKVTFRAEYEKGNTHDNRARNESALDEFTTWYDAGAPIVDTSGLTNPLANPDRLYLVNSRDRDVGIWWLTANRAVYINNTGETLNVRNYLITDTQGDKEQSIVLQDGFLDRSMSLQGPYAVRQMPFETYTATLEMNPVKDLFLEVSFNNLDSYFQNYDPTIASLYIYGDPNSHHLLLDGTESATPTPYYLETSWYSRSRTQDVDSLRATASYSFDLNEGRMGRHQLGFLYEKIDDDYSRAEVREALEEPVYNADPENAQNRVYRRQYFNPGQYDQMYAPNWDQEVSFLINGETYGTRWVPFSESGNFDDVYTTESIMGVLQSFWLDGRVVTTIGHRQDRRTLAESGAFRDPVTRIFTIDTSNPSITEYTPDTTTFGIVGHLNDQVSVLFNKSSSVTLADTNMRVWPDWRSPDPSDNEGMDVGFNFSLFEDKVSLRATYFESEAVDAANYSRAARFIKNGVNRAYEGLANAGYITSEQLDGLLIDPGAHYFDRDASGYELRLNANFTRNWSLMLNASETDVVETNIMKRIAAFHDEVIADVASIAPGDDGDDSVYSELDFADENGDPIASSASAYTIYGAFFDDNQSVDTVAFFKSFEGKEAFGNRKHKFNAFTRYTFREGRLKGAYVGGGYRWQSGLVNDVDLVTGELQYSEDVGLFDLLVGFRTNVWEDKTLEFQLNVQNAFDDDTFHAIRLATDGETLLNGYYEDPRTVRFTTRLKF